MSQNQPANPTVPDAVCGWQDALLEEYAAIFCDDWNDGAPPPRTRTWLHEHRAALCEHEKTALCLSGGGIRSAALCLGALQALARKGVLGEFNYLSTVSGGGYIGAWLATIMHGGGKGNGALSAANKALKDPTDPALRSLRNYTNFLIPEGGFGSSDTWSAIVLWLRNVLLNWLVFGPVLLAVAVVPLLYRGLLADVSPGWGWTALIAGLACLFGGTIMVCRSVPTHAYDADKDRVRPVPMALPRRRCSFPWSRRCWRGRSSHRSGSRRCRPATPRHSCPGPLRRCRSASSPCSLPAMSSLR